MNFPRRAQYSDETSLLRGVDFAPMLTALGTTLVSSPAPSIRFLAATFSTDAPTVAGTQVVFHILNPVKGLYQFVVSASVATGDRIAMPCELEVPL